jgi:hypothetical protein
MTDPLGSVRRPIRPRKVRGRKGAAFEAPEVDAAQPPPQSAPAPPSGVNPEDIPPAVSAQMMGQNDPAETAALAAKALAARSAYLSTEWSGPHDRRTRRGRIAKTEV